MATSRNIPDMLAQQRERISCLRTIQTQVANIADTIEHLISVDKLRLDAIQAEFDAEFDAHRTAEPKIQGLLSAGPNQLFNEAEGTQVGRGSRAGS